MRVQTRAQRSAVRAWAEYPGTVSRSRRQLMSMAHEEATLQRCRSAAAVEVACSPHKTCLQTYLQSRRFGGFYPARTHAATEARCAPRLRPDFRNPLSCRAPEYEACVYTALAFSQRPLKGARDGRNQGGQKLKNARV